MTITLLNRRNYKILKSIQENFPNLTFQNDGYQYLEGHVKLTDRDRKAIRVVTLILKKCIHHLHEFNNFKLRKDGTVTVRVQYNWDPSGRSFEGVGYVSIDELRHGFSFKKHGPIFFQDDLKHLSILEHLEAIKDLNKSGFAGVNSDGMIVDRREFPDAIEIQANKLMGVAEPKQHDFTV